MKRQNNKKGNLKKKRKYNDLENDNFYEDDHNESNEENSLAKKIKRTFFEVQSANILNAESKHKIVSDEAFEFANEVAKKSHLEVKPQQSGNAKEFLGDEWMKMFKGCQVTSNCEDKSKCVLDIRIRLGNVNNEIIHFVISFLKENDFFD